MNLAALLIAFREGLEAALITGILISYLHRIGRRDRALLAWAAVGAAILTSALIAVAMLALGASLETPYEQVFEGTTMLVAVAILTWMIFWMRYQSRFLKHDLESQLKGALNSGANLGLATLIFVAVFREGVETALFLAASAFSADGASTLAGALLGLALAATTGIAIFGLSFRLNLHQFFSATSLLLILFAAGLLAHAVHEYQEIGWLPLLANSAWSTEWLLPNDSGLGALLRSLLGYNATPSVLEVVGYASYWLVILLGIRWLAERAGLRLTRQKAN